MSESSDGGFLGLVGIRDQTAHEGKARLELDATEKHLNSAGGVHGGVLATLVDTAMGRAVRSRLGEDEGSATSQLTVTYLRPGKPGTLVVTAEVRKQGEHLTMCEADVEQEGKALVHAVATFAVLRD